ncbi:hypothetical protein P879_00448 [Paragonimus westermani]|uniref:Uncharacterized protein n=1 Tax=Paragonimus westermani TaxID=34504 RepID=A0A8T0E0J7_9TREM|nr:hypothetical protein P879_00448 [Paragonimus westermani]
MVLLLIRFVIHFLDPFAPTNPQKVRHQLSRTPHKRGAHVNDYSCQSYAKLFTAFKNILGFHGLIDRFMHPTAQINFQPFASIANAINQLSWRY